ncbi:hypothetical protein NCG97_01670 [Streptomyces lydicamycinicus]|uniref:hypothetical protein n=1 Tax=Streptomyces lydicamycinicus TaxID=1546107 RepID=UPI002034AA0D|nr:hypothetical protein [Streptomyces lydicamycinicus]URZ99672.1 hypothetical protein NCG97_01670 [Streptomyces lydicamycinicus]
MFRREARRRGVAFSGAGTNWTCEPGVQQAASEVWQRYGNAPFNRYVFGRLWPEQAEAKAHDLLTAWTRERPDLVIAECSDLGAHLAARALQLPLLAADNGLGPVLLDLWDTHIAPALLPLYKQYEQDTPTLPRCSPPRRSTGSTRRPHPRRARSDAPSRPSAPPSPSGWTLPPPSARRARSST